MGLTYTRPEQSEAMTIAVGDTRNALAATARTNNLNIAEAISVSAQVFTSLLVGAYKTEKDREVVIQALPDLVRAYIPQWEQIYAAFAKRQSSN